MLSRDYNFKGKHANIVTNLTTELDGNTKFKFFERNIDVLILAPLVGFLYGHTAERDDSGATDNIKKINFDQMNREAITLNFNYELIMILNEKEKIPIEERLNLAFRNYKNPEEKAKADKLFESFLLGGIEILEEKLLSDANSVDDYIVNIYNIITDYNDRYSKTISENDLLDLCINNN